MEAELEHINDVGLRLNNTKNLKSSPQNFSHSCTPIPQPSDVPMPNQQIHTFGCRWDPNDYSCSYDVVFTALIWAYSHANEGWRATWAGQNAAAQTLSRHFKTIVHTIQGPANGRSPPSIPMLFSRGRNAFRDVLSEGNPRTFRRRGPVFACLTDILSTISHLEQSSQYLSVVSYCGGANCTIKTKKPPGAPTMLTPYIWKCISGSEVLPYHQSLQEWVARWLDWNVASLPSSCSGCHREYSRTRSFLSPPWIWFEIFLEQPHVVLPAFKLSFSPHTYRLAAVMYGDGSHFVARLSTPCGTWWHYNGQEHGGRPTAVSITSEEELLTCGNGYIANALLYCMID